MSRADLTWEEKNSAVYLYYPVDLSVLRNFVKAEKRKQKRERKQRQNKKKII